MSYTSEAASGRFENLSGRSRPKVYSLALKLVGNPTEAEDLTQEAMYRAFRRFDMFQGDRPFENWVLRIVQRLFLDFLRHRRRRVTTVSYDVALPGGSGESDYYFEQPDDSKNPERVFMGAELGEELTAGMKGLTPDQQRLVKMADIDDMSYAELAERENVPVGTIRSRLHRAHCTLRLRLEKWESANQDHLANLKLFQHKS